jgi:hypothetical protein
MSDPNQQWQPPPPPDVQSAPVETGPDMSTPATLSGIFFEPGRTFDALRKRPRFLIVGIILVLLTTVVDVALFTRIDMGQYIREKMEQSQSSQSQGQTEEQKELTVKILKVVFGVIPPVSIPIVIAAGAGLYLLGVMAFGGTISYKRSVAVWAYSWLPPTIIGCIVAVLVLFLKAAETIDPEHLLVTNPGAFTNAHDAPVLTAFLSQFDLIRFYGMFLAAIGLRKVAKISSGSAWGIVLGYWLIGLILSVAWHAIRGQ